MLFKLLSSITTTSPFSISLMNFAPIISNAHVSEANTYESFIFRPDTYKQEGSTIGQIGNNIEVQIVKTFPRPEKGYEEWCKQNGLPCVGTHFPLANFVNEKDAQQVIYADSIKIKHD